MFHTETFDAIGVRNQVTVCDGAALPEATTLAKAADAELDRTCSRFRDDSELSRLNSSGEGIVSPLLLELIRAALDAARWSGGLVDRLSARRCARLDTTGTSTPSSIGRLAGSRSSRPSAGEACEWTPRRTA